MKKYLLLGLILGFCINSALATENPSDKYKKKINYPSAVSYPTSATTTNPKSYTSTQTTNSSSSKKAQLDSIARQMLKAGENHQDILPYQKKFIQMGVTEICPPQIIAKRTPTCPPIKVEVNGRTLSGSKCAVMCYKYNNKQYDVGYCK